MSESIETALLESYTSISDLLDLFLLFDLVSQNTKNFWEYLDSINFVFDFGLVLEYLQNS